VALTEADILQAVSSFEDFVRAKRLKMTDQRRQMVRAALEKRGHFTAEELYRDLSGSADSVSMATVYRGLALLEEAELIEGHDFADGQRRFERSLDREHHDHMICVDCRAVIEFTNQRIEKLQDEAAKSHGFTLEDHSLTLFVRCNDFRDGGSCERRDERLARLKAAEG
jgi:Fur family ferric uptake transcriptional regulator